MIYRGSPTYATRRCRRGHLRFARPLASSTPITRRSDKNARNRYVSVPVSPSLAPSLTLHTYRKRVQPPTTRIRRRTVHRAAQGILDIPLHHRPARTLPAQVVPGAADGGPRTRFVAAGRRFGRAVHCRVGRAKGDVRVCGAYAEYGGDHVRGHHRWRAVCAFGSAEERDGAC